MLKIIGVGVAVFFSAAVCLGGPKRQPQHFTFSPGTIRGDVKVFRMPLPPPEISEEDLYSSPSRPSTPRTPRHIDRGYSKQVSEWAEFYRSQTEEVCYKVSMHPEWRIHSYCHVTDSRGDREGWYLAEMDYEMTSLIILRELATVAKFNMTRFVGGSLKIDRAPDQAHEYCNLVLERIHNEENE